MPATAPDLVERTGGASFAAGTHRTLALDDPGRIYVVEQGTPRRGLQGSVDLKRSLAGSLPPDWTVSQHR